LGCTPTTKLTPKPRQEPDLGTRFEGQGAVAVELHLVDPVAGGQLPNAERHHRLMKEKLFSRDEGFTLSSMPDGPAHMLNRLECQADFTYGMGPKTIKIEDTGKGPKPVGEDLEAVLRKIEGWHQGSISGFLISYRDREGSGIRSQGKARK
jgi:hypothetical protein